MFQNVTVKNSMLYAAKCYDNPQCLDAEEFKEDVKRFKYIKRLCKRYNATKEISERLLLNHLVSLVNVFGPEATVRLLFLKCDDVKSWQTLKPFLSYLSLLPPVVHGVDGQDIYTDSIPLDVKLLTRIQEL